MKKYILIWYDTESEKKRDHIQANNEEEAKQKGYQKYSGNPPARLISVMEDNE